MNARETTIAAERGLTEYKSRQLPDGAVVEFELADIGTKTKSGEPRKRPYRAYYYRTPNDPGRARLTSVTTLLDAILPKPGLAPWYEMQGIMGAREALLRRLVHDGTLFDQPMETSEDWVRIVRENNLGADAARDLAASRGLNIHALLEEFMRTGRTPDKRDHPEYHHGFIQALCSFLLDHDPEPVAVEELVVDPVRGYAGRRDLVANVKRYRRGSLRVGFDAKTQPNAGIYASAHLQLRMYEEAAVAHCGDEPCDELDVVVFAENGEYRLMPCEAGKRDLQRALRFYESLHPIDSLCEAWNRSERKARA